MPTYNRGKCDCCGGTVSLYPFVDCAYCFFTSNGVMRGADFNIYVFDGAHQDGQGNDVMAYGVDEEDLSSYSTLIGTIGDADSYVETSYSVNFTYDSVTYTLSFVCHVPYKGRVGTSYQYDESVNYDGIPYQWSITPIN